MVGLSVAVVVFGAAAWPTAAPAGADAISSTRAQMRSLQQQVVASAGRIRTLTLAYEQANVQAGDLAQQVAADRDNVARLRGNMTATATALRAGAILGYTGGPASTASGRTGSDDPAIRAEYLQVAAGDLTDVIDQYRTQMAEVNSAETVLASELRASDAAVQTADQARRAALAQASTVEGQLTSVEVRLQGLQAAQAAADAAAAAQARADAAARAAAARAAAPQGLPVNGGLVAVVRSVVSSAPASGGVWLQLRQCESGDNYQANTGNGFYGAYQFSEQTWNNLGYPGRPDLEPPSMQDQAAQKLQSESGWGQWPACSAALGLS